MIHQFIKGLIALAIAASAPYALATKKLADEAGGGAAAGGSSGPRGGMGSAAAQHGTKRLNDRITGEMVREHTNPSKETPKPPKQSNKKSDGSR